MALTAKTVTLYKNTGLLPGNSMDSINTLLNQQFESVTVEPVITLQTRGLIQIRVEMSYEQVSEMDYCLIGDTCYWISGYRMINENVAELRLDCDYITTVGTSNIEVISGWTVRCHTKYDNPFDNTLEEPFTPMEPLALEYGSVIKPTLTNTITTSTNIVISNVDLDTVDYTALSYKDAANDLVVTVPQVPPASVPTVFGIQNFGNVYNLPMGSAYDYDVADTKVGINATRSLGIESAIVDSYSVPDAYIEQKEYSSASTRFGSLLGKNESVRSVLLPEYSDDGYTPKNAKALSGQFQKYILMSAASGDMQTYPVEDIIGLEGTNYVVTWQLLADLLPTGSPICRPFLYHGENLKETSLGNVRGLQWVKNPLRYNSPSGSLISDINFARQMQISAVGQAFNTAQTAFNTVLNTGNKLGALANSVAGPTQYQPLVDKPTAVIGGMATGVGGAVAGLASGIASSAQWALNARDSAAKYWTGRNIVAPEINFAPITGTVSYLGNYFYDLRWKLSKADLIRFDNYLTQYGYAVSQPFKYEQLHSRRYFNYIQVTDINIKTPGFGLDMKLGVINELEAGIRIWHTAPTAAAMTDNPVLN